MVSPSIYESVFRGSPIAEYLLSADPQFTILAVNDAFLRSSGRKREELVGVGLFQAFSANPDDSEDTGVAAFRRSLQKVMETRESDTLALQRYPIRTTTADGRERYEERFWSAMSTPIFDQDGKLICIAHSTIDVTELVKQNVESSTSAQLEQRARAEAGMVTRAQALQEINKALQAERTRLRHLFEHAPGFVYFTQGPQHVIEQANNALDELAGHRQLIGKTIREAFPEVADQGFHELHDEVYRSGRPVILHERKVHLRAAPDAPLQERVLDLVYQPIVDVDGSTIGVCGQGIDVTERKRAEDAVRAASLRKDEFLAMLAHELRNPLAPISAAAQILGGGSLDDAVLRRTGEIIARQVRHMTGLVDDLLDVSRVTRGAITVQKTPQDIKHVVTSAVEQVRPTIESNRHRLTINLAPQPAHVCGDEKRLVQILSNLLNNATKYTPAGGNIELRVEIDADAVIVKVIDDGIGIGPELQPRVFDLFSQADRSAARSQGGLGLGLALVKSLVELHNGSVRCDSAGLGRGSCFTVSLPRFSSGIAQQEEPESVSQREMVVPRRILLVDDNVDAADTLALLLRIAGHEVSVEYDARGALERAGSERPEIFLLDVGLPDMDGIQLARTLRQRPESARSTFVAISGYGKPADRRAALDDGFDHHFVKPVASETLLSLIAQTR